MAPGDLAYEDALLQVNSLKYSCIKRRRVHAPSDPAPRPTAPSVTPATPVPAVPAPPPPATARPAALAPLPRPIGSDGTHGDIPLESMTPAQRREWANATSFIAAANRALARGEPLTAKTSLERAVRWAPWFADGVVALAGVEHAIGRRNLHAEIRRRSPEELARRWPTSRNEKHAEEILRLHRETYGDEAGVCLSLGAIFEDQRKYEEAIEAYAAAARASPDLAEAHLGHGRCVSLLRFYDGDSTEGREQHRLAFEDYERALSLDPDLSEARVRRIVGRLFLVGVRPITPEERRAIQQDLARVMESSPNYGLAHYARGMVALAYQEGDLIVPSMRRAVECDPQLAEAWTFLGLYCRVLQNPQESERYMRRAVEIDPRNFNAWYALGMSLCDTERWSDAIPAFTIAMQTSEDQGDTYVARAGAYHATGMFREAGEDARAALEQKHSLSPDMQILVESILQDPRVLAALGR